MKGIQWELRFNRKIPETNEWPKIIRIHFVLRINIWIQAFIFWLSLSWGTCRSPNQYTKPTSLFRCYWQSTEYSFYGHYVFKDNACLSSFGFLFFLPLRILHPSLSIIFSLSYQMTWNSNSFFVFPKSSICLIFKEKRNVSHQVKERMNEERK